jgi:alkylhydroperoxidase family enzyme
MKPLPLQQWDASLEHVVNDMNGRPLNVHSLMANHPDLLKAWWPFRNYSVAGGSLRQRECELVILRVAVHMRSWYEWAAHVDRGLASGLALEEIERVREGPGAPGWSDGDALLLQAVDELIATHAIEATTQQELAGHFSGNQVMDVIAIHGMYVTLGCMINTWEPPLDAFFESRLPATVSRDNFEQGVGKQE